jgi:superfamily II DNA or RNA helicase
MDYFLTNTSKSTFLNALKTSLSECNSFSLSVSFIKVAGLRLISADIEKALQRGVTGRVITSTYQNFTDIASLELLSSWEKQYPNFKCHIDFHSFGDAGFHTKGYIFEIKDQIQIMIGSSNLTRYALIYNVEWNISSVDRHSSPMVISVLKEFEEIWNTTFPLTKEIIDQYHTHLEIAIEKWDMDYIQTYSTIKPNYMQRKALIEIRRYRDLGVNKALVIAAMGSGKTYLAAFDALNFGAKKLLFVVHRETILKDAQRTFETIFGHTRTYGFYTGSEKEITSDFIFSTNIALANSLGLFDRNSFDYIVIDEVHHSVASTYQMIIEYFTPQFLLGLTATPERMDQKSVFDLFEKNVPYELRLREALIYDLIVPFKYYGIRDQLVDYSLTDARSIIKQLSSDIHCDFIAEKIEKYRPEGKLKAVCFCTNIEHARLMSLQMTNLGYSTTSLTGKNDTGERIGAFNELQDDHKKLEIIFTVDILNEGVDIPLINLVMFLRPTESSTIFLQQLGRGLRKAKGKEFLTVLDFIGNSYKRSVQIALALGTFSESHNIDKRILSECIRDNYASLKLPIEIHFDQLSKEEILESIQNTNFNSMVFLKQEYFNYKKYLNLDRVPNHCDYIESDVPMDLLKFIRVCGSYYNFLIKINEENIPSFTQNQGEYIESISAFLPLVRNDEFLILNHLKKGPMSKELLINSMLGNEAFSLDRFNHALNHLQCLYYSEKEQQTKHKLIYYRDNLYYLNTELSDTAYTTYIHDLLKYGLNKFSIDYQGCVDQFKLYSPYTRTQFMMQIMATTMAFREGIKTDNNQQYFFIDLKKDINKSEWLLYNDKFIDASILQWESQTETTLTNKKGLKLLIQKSAFVFVRKIQKEDGLNLPYIYIGECELTNPRESTNIRKSLLMDLVLKNPIPQYMQYEFQIGQEEL